MTTNKQKTKKDQDKKLPENKRAARSGPDDPNAIHDIYTEKDLDPGYDGTIGDDIAYDYEGPSGDPGDRPKKKKGEKDKS